MEQVAPRGRSMLIVVGCLVAVSLALTAAKAQTDDLLDVVELRVGLVEATAATIVHRGALEGPAASTPQAWTELEGVSYPLGFAIGILDADDSVLGIRLFRPGTDQAELLAEMLIEPGVDGETEIEGQTLVVQVVATRRESAAPPDEALP